MRRAGDGLQETPMDLAVQEYLNNLFAQDKKNCMPVQDVLKSLDSWRKKIEAHYKFQKRLKKFKSRRTYLTEKLGIQSISDSKRFRLPRTLANAEKPLPEKWANREVNLEDLVTFFFELSGVSKGLFQNTLFIDLRRPSANAVDRLHSALKIPDLEKEDFYHKFGRHPGVDQAEQKRYLLNFLNQKWKVFGYQAAEYLLLSNTTMYQILPKAKKDDPPAPAQNKQGGTASPAEQKKERTAKIHTSTLYRFVIATGKKTETELNDVYHNLGLHPLKVKDKDQELFGEADAIVFASAMAYDDLVKQLGGDNPQKGSNMFFLCLYTLLKHYDEAYAKYPLLGLFFYQQNLEYDYVDTTFASKKEKSNGTKN